jgi:2-furoyl-CoA dehydrogenase large subunit
MVIAHDRYLAEDALEKIEVTYQILDMVVDPVAAARDDAPLVHPAAGTNLVSVREYSYGDPSKAFAEADHRVSLTVSYPRNSQTPLEGFVVVAEYDPQEQLYNVMSNFQGPFTVHPVMARALRVPGTNLRMRTAPYSGGGFGVKQAIFPYVVLACIASRIVDRPVKWVEDRLEHLTAAIAAPNRVIQVQAAVTREGRVTALDFNQLDDYGAYLRPPMPGPLYRQHGIMTGPYDIPNLAITNRLVLTNKTPSGMVRGFGGPQIYYALERIMHRVAETLDLERLDVIRRNLISRDAFPYRAAGGALLDSGDFQTAVDVAVKKGNLAGLVHRRDEARAEGRLYGIGMAVVSEPGQSNMGYLSTIQTVEERHRSGHKGGNVSNATVNVEPLGTVNVTMDSIPQGQGHATILSQIVADQLGLRPDQIRVNQEHDTHKDAWSIATGNYSSRFSSATAVAAHLAAVEVREKMARIASQSLNMPPDAIEFANGMVFARGNPENALKFHRVAGTAHWSPGNLPSGMSPGLRASCAWSPPELEPPDDEDRINTSLTYGFVFDFCGVEIDRDTGRVQIDRYVTMHDSGKLLNPLIANGQVYGAFSWGLGCALFEEFVYGDDGSFLSGTFADYLVPTAYEVPEPQILHMETPTPFTPLGAKGIGEGNVMSTPVCLANGVADALGVENVTLPLSPSKVSALIHGEEVPPPEPATAETSVTERVLNGSGSSFVPAARELVWATLIDPARLAAVLPGCRALKMVAENDYRATISLGVGPVSGEFKARITFSDLMEPGSARISGAVTGPLGVAEGEGRISLETYDNGTQVSYLYGIDVNGKVVAVGGRMLSGATRALIAQFFRQLVDQVGGPVPSPSYWQRLLGFLRFRP